MVALEDFLNKRRKTNFAELEYLYIQRWAFIEINYRP